MIEGLEWGRGSIGVEKEKKYEETRIQRQRDREIAVLDHCIATTTTFLRSNDVEELDTVVYQIFCFVTG
jgi:hypothetical protein